MVCYTIVLSINSISSDRLVKIYNRSQEYRVVDYESGILLIKVILDKSGLQIQATVIKEKTDLASIPEIMVQLTHNVRKFSSQALTTT